MHTIRSFIAIPLPNRLQSAVGTILDSLSDDLSGVQWVPSDNVHLTLKFLGDVPDRDIPDVCKTLRQCRSKLKPFSLHLEGTGAFPSIDRPRVIWIGVDDASGQVA